MTISTLRTGLREISCQIRYILAIQVTLEAVEASRTWGWMNNTTDTG